MKPVHRFINNLLILRIAGALTLISILAITIYSFGPEIIDDAYITFRYARNFADGNGLVFNPGEYVQGSSTPLFALILALSGIMGVGIPFSALAISVLFCITMMTLLVMMGYAISGEAAGWVAAFAVSTQLFWVLFLVSGMETTLYCFCVLTVLAAVGSERWHMIGVFVALTCLVRYDGAIVGAAAFSVMFWRAGWRVTFREIVIAVIVYLPWFIFAWVYFGNPIPQSVQAKYLIENISWAKLIWHYKVYLTTWHPLFYIWASLAAVGTYFITTKRKAWIIVPLWCALYSGAFIIKRMPVLTYPWYLTPLIAPVLILASVGLNELARHGDNKYSNWRVALVAVILLIPQIGVLIENASSFGPDAERREELYFKTADALRPFLKPGDTILVGEVGTLGWALPEARVIDSVGLVSRDVHEVNLQRFKPLDEKESWSPAARKMEAERTLAVLKKVEPDFITTKLDIMNLQGLVDDDWFAYNYEQLTGNGFEGYGQWTWRNVNRERNKKNLLKN